MDSLHLDQSVDPELGRGPPPASYLVMHQNDAWFIRFDGEEFGPYKSEREALLFAVDAAKKLGDHGRASEVSLLLESGAAQPVWSYGLDPYPPSPDA